MGLDESLALITAAVGAGFGLPFAMAWVERTLSRPPATRKHGR